MRNLDYRYWLRSVLVTAALVSIVGTGNSFAQSGKSIFSGRKNSGSRFQSPNQSSVTQQPSVSSQPPYSPPPAFGSIADEQFIERLNRAIEITSKRHLTANSHSPWQIFHSILALRTECLVRLGTEKVNAIEWLSTKEPQFDGQPWMLLTPHGAKFHPYTKTYFFEGHPGQFLALLSQSNLPLDHKFHVQGKVVTLNDVVNNTMKEVNSKEEVTWVLWALQHFLKPDAEWLNQHNESWSIRRLVEMETASPVVGAPCGGNHRLFALTRARDKYLQNGGTLRNEWLAAHQKIKQHIEIARSLQNRDGSFSSDWYKGPGQSTQVNERFNTTGHIMEFLAISLPAERLNEPWVRSAVWTLSTELIFHQNTKIDGGPLFHTLDALILYRDRIKSTAPAPQIANPAPENKLSQVPAAKPVPFSSGLASSPLPLATVPLDVKVADPGNRSVINLPAKVPLPSDTKLPETAMEQGVAKKSKSSVTEWRSANICGEPAGRNTNVEPSQSNNSTKQFLAPKLVQQKSPPPRIQPPRLITHPPLAGEVPALLPETSAKPLTNSELSAEIPIPSAESIDPEAQVKVPSSVGASTDRPLFEKPAPAVPDNSGPLSALEPSNL